MSFKTGNDDLFQLVKSLKQAEKRYFKVFASQQIKGEKNNYVKLFEALDKQDTYDEKKLLRSLRDIPASKLGATKHYLQGLVLKSLRNYYADSSPDTRIRDLLTDAEILFTKSQYRACAKALARAEELADKFGKYAYVSDICRWQRKLVNIDLSPGAAFTHEDVFEKERNALRMLQNIQDYRELYIKADRLRRETNAVARKEEELEQFRSIKQHDLMQDESKALVFESRCLFWSIRSLAHVASGEQLQAYEADRRFLALFEEEPHQVINHFSNYLVALNNSAYTSYTRQEYDEAGAYITRLRALPGLHPGLVNEKMAARIFSFSSILELNILIDTGSFTRSKEFLGRIEKGLEEHDALLDHEHRLVFCYNIAYLAFGQGDYKKSIHYLNELLNCSKDDYRHELNSFARILLLVAHYELGNTDLIHYLVKSTHRFLYLRQRLYKYETIVLNILKKLPGTAGSREMMDFFRYFRDELLHLSADPFESKAFYYFDMIAWLDSKISKIPFEEAFRERLSAAGAVGV